MQPLDAVLHPHAAYLLAEVKQPLRRVHVLRALFYKETLGIKQIIGIVLCMGGMVLING